MRIWGQDWELLRAGYDNGALAAALYCSRNYSDRSLRELGQLAGGMQGAASRAAQPSYPAVTLAIRRFSERLPSDKALAKKIKRLAQKCYMLRRDPDSTSRNSRLLKSTLAADKKETYRDSLAHLFKTRSLQERLVRA